MGILSQIHLPHRVSPLITNSHSGTLGNSLPPSTSHNRNLGNSLPPSTSHTVGPVDLRGFSSNNHFPYCGILGNSLPPFTSTQWDLREILPPSHKVVHERLFPYLPLRIQWELREFSPTNHLPERGFISAMWILHYQQPPTH